MNKRAAGCRRRGTATRSKPLFIFHHCVAYAFQGRRRAHLAGVTRSFQFGEAQFLCTFAGRSGVFVFLEVEIGTRQELIVGRLLVLPRRGPREQLARGTPFLGGDKGADRQACVASRLIARLVLMLSICS